MTSRLRRLAGVDRLVWGLIAVGAILRLWQYLGRDSFYLDEAALLRNIVDRSWSALVGRPLDYDQLAPPGFLLVEKLAAIAAGVNEYATRAFPLACAVASVPVFALLARRLLSAPAAIAAALMFATAGPLVVFGAQVKQYSTDVLGTCVLLLFATTCLAEGRPRHHVRLGVAGAAVVWFSQPAILVMAAIGASLAIDQLRRVRRGAARLDVWLFGSLAAAAVSACAAVLVAKSALTPSGSAFMHWCWVDGFPPGSLSAWLSRPWPFPQMVELLGDRSSTSFGFPVPALFVVTSSLGLVVLAARGTGRLVVAPVLVTLATAGAGQYPFTNRFLYFVAPCFFLAIAAAAERAATWLGRWFPQAIRSLPLLPAAAASVPVLLSWPTYHRDDLRPALQYVAAERRSGEKVYLYYGAAPVFWYYGPPMGLADASLVAGKCHRGEDRRAYLRELDALRGDERAYVVFSHPDGSEVHEMKRYLDTIGTRRSTFVASNHWFSSASEAPEAIEYDFSARPGFSAARADTFPVAVRRERRFIPCDRAPVAMPYERLVP